MDTSLIATSTEHYVKELFNTFTNREFSYHNLKHTTLVVLHAREIARHYSLNETNVCIVTIAAWFHDVGHLFGEMQDHEETGVSIMKNYMATIHTPPEIVIPVAECIMATKKGNHPDKLIGKILCDADTYHFGTDYFRKTDPAMRQELELRTGKTFPAWAKMSLDMLLNHQFQTDYCQKKLREGKLANINWLKTQLPDL